MSQINFESLIGRHPELASSLHQLAEWVRNHPRVKVIDPRRLSRDLDVTPLSLVMALQALVADGHLKHVYKLENKDGVFAGPDFDSPEDFPEEIEDRFGDQIRVSDGRIVAVFREETANEGS